jgi:hypothetical protein
MNYSRAREQLSSVGHHEALKQPPAVHQECVTKSSNHFAHSGSPADKASPNMRFWWRKARIRKSGHLSYVSTAEVNSL